MIYWGHLSLIKLLKFVVDFDIKYVFKGMTYAVVVFHTYCGLIKAKTSRMSQISTPAVPPATSSTFFEVMTETSAK